MAGVAVAGIAATIFLVLPLFRHTDLDRFWAPLVDASSPVVMCVGQPKAFKLDTKTLREVEDWMEKTSDGEKPPAPSAIPFASLKPVWDRTSAEMVTVVSA